MHHIFNMFEYQYKFDSLRNVNISLVYEKLCALIEIFNMFENRYEFESFQSQVRRVDVRNWYQLGSNVKKKIKK